MKNFKSLEDAKAFSIELNKIFKQSGLNSKQSMILEALSHAEGYANWNILSAKYKEVLNLIQDIENGNAKPISHKTEMQFPQGKPSIYKPINQIKFPDTEYFHIDNGGFFFSFAENVLMIKTSFFGYTNNVHYFRIDNEVLKTIINMLKSNQNETQVFSNCNLKYEDGKLIFENEYNELSLGLYLAPIDKMIIYFEKLLLENKAQLNIKQEEPIHSLDDMIKEMNKKSIAKLPLLTLNQLTAIAPDLSKDNINFFFDSIENVEQHLHKQGKLYNLKTVLNNMAMRYRHDFGLFDEPERNKLVQYMKQLYHGFIFNLDETKLKTFLQIDNVSFEQLKEEFTYQTQKNKTNYKM
jgi:hypothetical protein